MYLHKALIVPALVACLAAQVTAIPLDEPHGTVFNDLVARDRASDIGVRPGKNPTGPNSDKFWLGAGGPRKITFINNAGQDLKVILWGRSASYVNTIQPIINVPIQSKAQVVVSVQNDPEVQTGFAAVYPDTRLKDGQIFNTWGEARWDDQGLSVYDVNRQINSRGHAMTIYGSRCNADMDRCVFVCKDPNAESCSARYSYLLQNCDPGSQTGASSGSSPEGDPSGGCVSNSSLYVYFR